VRYGTCTAFRNAVDSVEMRIRKMKTMFGDLKDLQQQVEFDLKAMYVQYFTSSAKRKVRIVVVHMY
jgi:hypothetical protein